MSSNSVPLGSQSSAPAQSTQPTVVPLLSSAGSSGSMLPRSAASTSAPSTSAPARSSIQGTSAFRPPTQSPVFSTVQTARRSQPFSAAAASSTNAVPSIFGFYSHDGIAANSPSRSSGSPGNAASRRDIHRPSTSLGQAGSPRLGSAATASPRAYAKSAAVQQTTFEETTTISFTWVVRDLELLREEVEYSEPPAMGGRSVSAGAGKSEVWTTRPLFGDGKWRLELIRTTRTPSTPAAESSEQPGVTVLSVYLTAVALDYIHPDAEIPASIMIAIRPIKQPVGGAASPHGGYTWRRFYEYTFSREVEFFTCHDLPSLSEMLQDPGIMRDDAFALTIQLGVGPGHLRNGARSTPFEVDGHDVVPRAMVDSLHGLLDDANSGDVRILVRERGLMLKHQADAATTQIVPYPVGSTLTVPDDDPDEPWCSDPEHVFVRDRVLWSHSSVLRNRSEYFATMLASAFSEGIADTASSDRSIRTVRIPDADFGTVYWFLRYLYTQQIRFADKQDVRSAVLDQDWTVGAEQPASEQDETPAAFDWTSIAQLRASMEDDVGLHDQRQYATTSGAVRARTSSQHGAISLTSAPSSPLGPHRDRPLSFVQDPHTHPTSQPHPASALSIFKLAHRYNMDDLSRIASAHLVASLTPDSAFPLLLATSMYNDLHQSIKTYVHHNWNLVSHSPEFAECCDQVSAGVWGPGAGKTLRAFISSLVSPLSDQT